MFEDNKELWIKLVRFDDVEDAIKVACEWIPQMTINGYTAEDVVKLGLEG